MTQQLGRRYWTALKYLSVLYLVYAVASVLLGWTNYRTVILLPAVLAVVLWKPRPMGWFFLEAWLAFSIAGYLALALTGHSYRGSATFPSPTTPESRIISVVLAVGLSITAIYFWKRKGQFLILDRKYVWLKGMAGIVLALVIASVPQVEPLLDPSWNQRDLARYSKYLSMEPGTPPVQDSGSSKSSVPASRPSAPKSRLGKDVNTWSYTPEFARRFDKEVLAEPSPVGASAVAFQVKWAEDVDICHLDLYVDNTLPLRYAEGDIGIDPFIYPNTLAFLTLTSQDRDAIERTYLSKYRESGVFIRNQTGEHVQLQLVKYRRRVYEDLAYLSFIIACDRVPTWGRSETVATIRTTSGAWHQITLPEPFLKRTQAHFRERYRNHPARNPSNPDPINVWTYTPEFAQRFGLPIINEESPTGVDAVAYRAEHNLDDPDWGDLCLIDLFVKDTVPLRLPEDDIGFTWRYPSSVWFVLAGPASADDAFRRAYSKLYMKPDHTEWITIKELRTLWDHWTYRNKKRLEGNTVQIAHGTPLRFHQYRKYAVADVSYISLDLGCMTRTTGEDGQTEIRIEKTDGTKHRIILPKAFLKRMHAYYREKVQIPHEIRLFGKPLEPL